MNEKYEKYLPLGSVVLIKNAKKRIMIVGYAAKTKEKPDKIWDYVGCFYPEGVVSQDKNLLFDHKDIGNIYALGYSDDEHKRYIAVINKLVDKLSKEENK